MFYSYVQNKNNLKVPIPCVIVRLKLESASKPVNIGPDRKLELYKHW